VFLPPLLFSFSFSLLFLLLLCRLRLRGEVILHERPHDAISKAFIQHADEWEQCTHKCGGRGPHRQAHGIDEAQGAVAAAGQL
jgi:hypothetical protein